MKTKEQIEEKIKQMKISMEDYTNHFNSSLKINYLNGLPLELEKDVIYNTIKNQIEALEWVLKDTKGR
jgi:hypothetical protein